MTNNPQPLLQPDALTQLTILNQQIATLLPTEVYQQVTRLAVSLTDAAICDILVYEPVSYQCTLVASTRDDAESLLDTVIDRASIMAGPCKAVFEGKTVIETELGKENHDLPAVFRPEGMGCAVHIPISGSETVAGVMSLYLEESPASPLLLTVSTLLAALVARVMLHPNLTEAHRHAEQQILDQQRQIQSLDEEMTALAYAISHDLDAPVRAIQGFSAALAEDFADRLEGEGMFYVKRMQAAGDQIEGMTQALLRLSRLAQRRLYRRPVDLSVLAHEIRQEMALIYPDRQIHWEIEDNLICTGDPGLLRALLDVLFDNAVKFTRQSSRAAISLSQVEYEGRAAFLVRDNGMGFDMQYSARLFKPFQKLHTDPDLPGDGMGLAMAWRIINRHGGEIWAESQPGAGAAFYFTIPAPVSDCPEEDEAHESPD